MLSGHNQASKIAEEVSVHTRLSSESVRREQVWAAVIRAVDFMLEETLSDIEDRYNQAIGNGDDEHVTQLTRKLDVVRSLRAQIEAGPPPRI